MSNQPFSHIKIEDRKIFGASVIDVEISHHGRRGNKQDEYREISQSSCDRLLSIIEPSVILDARNGIEIYAIWRPKRSKNND